MKCCRLSIPACLPACLVFLFHSLFGFGVSCSMVEWRMHAILEGVCGIEWAVNFCQALRCVWQWVYGRETGGVGARQGLTWSKTQMQSHIGKVREREKSHAGLPTYPPLPPRLLSVFPQQLPWKRWTITELWLPLPQTAIDLQLQKWWKKTPNKTNKHWILTVRSSIRVRPVVNMNVRTDLDPEF